MSKHKWDGSFSESQYVDTGNIVNDVIENGGRLLHEPTSDGYTHEIVDRGTYISDDYYFPQRIPGRKPHIHYEIRSSGGVFIDGKKIEPGGSRTMKHMRMRNLSKIEGTKIGVAGLGNEADEKVKQGEQLDELGRDFLSDKARLEQQYEAIESDDTLDRAHKISQLKALREAVVKLQEDYENKVTEKQEELQDELRALNEKAQQAEQALEKQIDSLRGVRMDAAATDTSAAAEAAEAERRKFQEWHAQNVEALNLRIEQHQSQRRNVLKNNLGGR